MPSFSRPARPQNDPDKYIRTVKGGKYQARPYDLGVRYNLGLYHTKHAARGAILEFWRGKLRPRFRFARPLPAPAAGGPRLWVAVVRVPEARDRAAWKAWRAARRESVARGECPPPPPLPRSLVSVRVPGVFATDVLAHEAAVRWLLREVGPLVAFRMDPESPVFSPRPAAGGPVPAVAPPPAAAPPPPAPGATFAA